MESLQLFLLVLQIIVAALMVICVLLQKSDGDSLSGIGGGSGGLNSVISSKSSANFLSKTTMVLITIFMLNCLILAALSNSQSKAISQELDKIAKEQEQSSAKTNEEGPNLEQSPKVPQVK